MRGYHEVFGNELQPLPRKPVLIDLYTPTDQLMNSITESWDS